MAPVLRTVLAATDFSGAGDAAVAWAGAVAPSGGTLLLVHVLDEQLYPSPLYAHFSQGVTPTRAQRIAQIEELRARLRALLPADAASRSLETRVDVLEGRDVAKAIRAAADRAGADILVLGSHRKGALRGVLVGSVARDVLMGAKRPVLLVPAPAEGRGR